MANVVIPENPEFNEALRIIETKDLVHADVVNPMFRTLLLNTIYLERRVAKMIERIDTLAIDNTYGGPELSADANIVDASAQFSVIRKTSSTVIMPFYQTGYLADRIIIEFQPAQDLCSHLFSRNPMHLEMISSILICFPDNCLLPESVISFLTPLFQCIVFVISAVRYLPVHKFFPCPLYCRFEILPDNKGL